MKIHIPGATDNLFRDFHNKNSEAIGTIPSMHILQSLIVYKTYYIPSIDYTLLFVRLYLCINIQKVGLCTDFLFMYM